VNNQFGWLRPDTPENLPGEGSSALDEFIQLAISKRATALKGEAHRWNRDEIYEERLSRRLREANE